MVSKVVPTIASDRYNALGLYILRERGDLTLTQIAHRGGLEPNRLGRWCRANLERLPPLEVLEGIAVGLGRPIGTVQAIALQAATGQSAMATISAQVQIALTALAGMSDENRQLAVDIVLRIEERDLAQREAEVTHEEASQLEDHPPS